MPFLELIRPLNVAIVFVSVLVGGWVGLPISFPFRLLVAALSAAFAAAFGNAINDCFDIEADRVNHPARPLPSGRISKKTALVFAGVLGASSLVISSVLGWPVLALVLAADLLLFFYAFKLKNTFFSNSVVALLCGLAFVIGGMVNVNIRAVFPAAFAFFFHYAREIVKDVLDRAGDQTSKSHSLALTIGPEHALKLAANGLVILALLLPLPVLLQQFRLRYLVAVAIFLLPLLVFIFVKLWSKPDLKTLQVVSTLLKVGMVIGLGALCLV